MYHHTHRSPERTPTSPRQQQPQAPYIHHPDRSPSAFHRPPHTDAPSSPRHPPNAPPLNGLGVSAHDRTPSTYYDPTSEHRRTTSWGDHNIHGRSPESSRHNYSYPSVQPERGPLSRSHHSPASPHRSNVSPYHTAAIHDRYPTSTKHVPESPTGIGSHNHQHMGPPPTTAPPADRPTSAPSSRVNDPMSFSNILASSDNETSASPRTPRKPSKPLVVNHDDMQREPTAATPPAKPVSFSSYTPEVAPNSEPIVNGVSHLRSRSNSKIRLPSRTSSVEKQKSTEDTENQRPSSAVPHKPRIVISDKEYQTALTKIDAMDHSDVEAPGFEDLMRQYQIRREKRGRELEQLERDKRKRRRIAHIIQITDSFDRQSFRAKSRFTKAHEKEAADQVHSEDVAQEKERKKVAQRNRRREITKQRAEQQAIDLKQRAEAADSTVEREKLIRDAERAEKKATATSRLLNGEVPNKDLREVTPLAPNLDGGVMSSFQTGEEAPEEPPKKKQRTVRRLKKSKEQKQAEKDTAAAAQAAIERGDDLVPIAPKTETSKSKRNQDATVDTTPIDRTPAAVKHYDQMYESIWKELAQQVTKKVYKIKKDSTDTKLANCRKTATLASKEARRWQIKTNKSTKDTQARAKRVMREMLSFWKKNERDERDQRKLAERQELDRARQAEKEREDNRQKRKLNFLMSQTELYSHFIWKKVRTDEVEHSTDDVFVSEQKIKAGPPGANAIKLPDASAKPAAKVTNFEDLDFDAEDDTALQAAAMANAQSAVEEAQARARAFNNNGELQSQFDDGEMNFQNPTSLQSMDIAQPKMLSAQLKEYQLKGLNWLVNLYEQGINGILADEMGLGKTIQSISVMAYLAEQHNIWGPFLVIAPSSTLHNWQQEITRFVPGLKVLPYWGNAKDRKVLRKYWDRKHITYNKESSFHVLVTSYQLVVHDQQYFQKVRWQYMILDEAQAIKSSQSSRWKSLLGFHCRNRLLLTGTPIQNSMQELWALLHFIMPSLFDSHDEFSDWFSKDIESHAQSNTKLNEDQLQRLHMILKPFMLRRIKKHVQKELGDKIEEDVFCDLTYRQRAYYSNLRDKISIMDLIEKAAIGDDQDTATLMNLVMQFRKVCNHPDLFERAETTSPVSFAYFAETASFLREGHFIDVGYSTRSHIECRVPQLIGRNNGRIDLPGPDNEAAGWKKQLLYHTLNIFTPDNISRSASTKTGAFTWLKFIDSSASEVASVAHKDVFQRAVGLHSRPIPATFDAFGESDGGSDIPMSFYRLFNIADKKSATLKTKTIGGGPMHDLMNVSSTVFVDQGLNAIEPCSRPAASAPPADLYCASQGVIREKQQTFFNIAIRKALFPMSEKTEQALIESKLDPAFFPPSNMLPVPISEKALWTKIQVPSMRRFVTDSGKLGRLDRLLGDLKEGGHRVLLYFQMTRMMDLMEEYLTYRSYKYCRLDGSTKLEDRRDTVADFQSREDIFVFLLSTRAGGLGINLTAADTVIFYDSDWNPTIDSQAMDRAHRLGQTRQVTVYRMITRGTIEERIRQRALQKEEVQRVVISGGAGAQVDFNTRSKENRTKDIAMWLADDEQAAEIEKKEAEIAEKEAKEPPGKRSKKAAARKKVEMSLDDMYHEGEGHFDDSSKPSGAATPVDIPKGGPKRKSKKAKTVKEKLAFVDGGG